MFFLMLEYSINRYRVVLRFYYHIKCFDHILFIPSLKSPKQAVMDTAPQSREG